MLQQFICCIYLHILSIALRTHCVPHKGLSDKVSTLSAWSESISECHNKLRKSIQLVLAEEGTGSSLGSWAKHHVNNRVSVSCEGGSTDDGSKYICANNLYDLVQRFFYNISQSRIWSGNDFSPKVSAAFDFPSFMKLSVQVDSEPWQASSVTVDQEVLHIRRWAR